MNKFRKIFVAVVIMNLIHLLPLGAQITGQEVHIDKVYEINCNGNVIYIAQSNDMYALMDTEWQTKTEFVYNKIDMLDDRIICADEGKLITLFNCFGVQINQQKFKEVSMYMGDEMAGKYFVVNTINKKGLINDKGEILIPLEFDSIDFVSMHKFFYAQKDGNKYYFDFEGNELSFKQSDEKS